MVRDFRILNRERKGTIGPIVWWRNLKEGHFWRRAWVYYCSDEKEPKVRENRRRVVQRRLNSWGRLTCGAGWRAGDRTPPQQAASVSGALWVLKKEGTQPVQSRRTWQLWSPAPRSYAGQLEPCGGWGNCNVEQLHSCFKYEVSTAHHSRQGNPALVSNWEEYIP